MTTVTYTIDQLARMVDHTNLHADATREDITKLCLEASANHFKMVAVNQVQSQLCARLLNDTDIDVGAAIAFPLGQTSIAAKEFETRDAIKNGANEIDYVINITELKAGNLDYIEEEMRTIVKACHKHAVPCKVIFENPYLTDEEIVAVAQIAKRVQPDFIKTATGFGPSGATVPDVRLMKQTVGDTVAVKAAGGIRDAATFKAMIAAGATRIGTSSGIKIMQEFRDELAANGTDTISIEMDD